MNVTHPLSHTLEREAQERSDRLDAKYARWEIFCLGALAGAILTGALAFLLG